MPCEQTLSPALLAEAPRLLEVIEADTLPVSERLQPSRSLLLHLAHVGRPHAKLAGKSALRRARASLESGLPDEQLDSQALAVGAQPCPPEIEATLPQR